MCFIPTGQAVSAQRWVFDLIWNIDLGTLYCIHSVNAELLILLFSKISTSYYTAGIKRIQMTMITIHFECIFDAHYFPAFLCSCQCLGFSGLMWWPFKISMATCINIFVWVPCQIWKAFFWCECQSDIATLAHLCFCNNTCNKTICELLY